MTIETKREIKITEFNSRVEETDLPKLVSYCDNTHDSSLDKLANLSPSGQQSDDMRDLALVYSTQAVVHDVINAPEGSHKICKQKELILGKILCFFVYMHVCMLSDHKHWILT